MNLKDVRRFDRSILKKSEITSQGFLKVPAFATRVGVFTYRTSDGGVIKELRCPSEVFNEDSMKTLANVPVTNLHPKPGLVSSENAKNFTVGYTGDQVENIEHKFLQVSVIVIDADTIRDASLGMKEVSCGYSCDLDPTPGIYEGEHYDVIQKNIVYNHLAIVPRGRAGPEVKLHLDADEAEMVSDQNQTKEIPAMGKITIKDKEYDATPEMEDAFNSHMKDMAEQMDGMKKELDGFKASKPETKDEPGNPDDQTGDKSKDAPEQIGKDAAAKPVEGSKEEESSESKAKELEEMKKQKDAVTAKADALESELSKLKAERSDTHPETILALVQTRMKLIATASRLMSDTSKLDSMTDLEIKKEVIKTDSPDANFEGKSDEYVSARFDHVEERLNKVASGRRSMGVAMAGTAKADAASNAPNAKDARKKMIEESKEAYKKPTGFSLKK